MKSQTVVVMGIVATLMGVVLLVTNRLGDEAVRILLIVLAGSGFSILGVVVGYSLGVRSGHNDSLHQISQPVAPPPQTPAPIIMHVPQPNLKGMPMYEQALGADGRSAEPTEQAPLMWQVK